MRLLSVLCGHDSSLVIFIWRFILSFKSKLRSHLFLSELHLCGMLACSDFFRWKPLLKLNSLSPTGMWAWMMGGNKEWCWDWDGEGCIPKSEQTDKGSEVFLRGVDLNRFQNNFHSGKTSCFSFGKGLLQLMPLSFLSFLVEKWACFFSLKQKFIKYKLSMVTGHFFLSLWLTLVKRWDGWVNLSFLFTPRWFDISFCSKFQWCMMRRPFLPCNSLFLVCKSIIVCITWYWLDFWL